VELEPRFRVSGSELHSMRFSQHANADAQNALALSVWVHQYLAPCEHQRMMQNFL
jgi:hypothetical protein